jgi:hypothetical protein
MYFMLISLLKFVNVIIQIPDIFVITVCFYSTDFIFYTFPLGVMTGEEFKVSGKKVTKFLVEGREIKYALVFNME